MYEREVDYELKTLSAQIEPILIVFLGVMVLVLALGIFLPIWDLGSAAHETMNARTTSRRAGAWLHAVRIRGGDGCCRAANWHCC